MISAIILGYGKIGKIRHKYCTKNGIKVVGIYDKNTRETKATNNLSEILKKDFNLAFLCFPSQLNYKYTNYFLKKNINVFCEKPPFNSSSQFRNLKKNIEKFKGYIQYGFNHREYDSIKKIFEICSKKKIGKIQYIRGRYGKSMSQDSKRNWRNNIKLSGGGVFLDQGIHLMDIILNLVNFRMQDIQIQKNYIKNRRNDTNVFLQGRSGNTTISMQSTLIDWRYLFSLEIFGEKGILILNGLNTPSGNYGHEILTYKRIAKGNIIDEKVYEFKKNNTFDNEIKYLKNNLSNRKYKTRLIKELSALSQIIDKVYK